METVDFELGDGHALVVLIERRVILGEQRDEEILRILTEVLDERSDPVGIDCFDRIEEHEREVLVDVVGEIAREREHETRDLALGLTEMLDRILV